MSIDLDHLVRRFKAGDKDAFDELYENTYRQVYFAILPILNDRSLAEDIVQDTYMKLCSCLDGYRENNLLAYVITIARNLAKNEYNRRKREIHIDSIEIDYSNISLASYLEVKAEKEELVQEILDSLDDDEKNVFLLHNLENLPHREIAIILDKPIGTITWIHAKAIKKLKAKFKER